MKVKIKEISLLSVTIYDIARLTGTNITAVSRAFRKDSKISKAKRELILKVAKEQGYRPNSVAGSLSRKIIHIGVAYRYEIPDFSKAEDREKYENDYLSPYYKTDGTAPTLPCCSHPDYAPTDLQMQLYKDLVDFKD